MVADDMEGWPSGLRQRISVRYTVNRIGRSNPSSLRHSRCAGESADRRRSAAHRGQHCEAAGAAEAGGVISSAAAKNKARCSGSPTRALAETQQQISDRAQCRTQYH
jgi:hypothetical protein